jgi:hypothetical protein
MDLYVKERFMQSPSPYRDLRTDFFRNFFEQALCYRDYLATGQAHERERWLNFEQSLPLQPEQEQRIQSFRRRMPILVMSGIWCGDCARQGPMLALLEKTNPLLQVRFIDNRQHPGLQEELRINGAEKVPVVVSLSEDFFELNRFGDRHLSVYRRKLEHELGAACDPGLGAPADELAEELEEWIAHFERLQAILRLSPMLRKRYAD